MTATERAQALVDGERHKVYGHPLPNHERIAAFWTVRLADKLKDDAVIEPHEAAACMRLVKESRLIETPGHDDSLVDISGYSQVEHLIHEGYRAWPLSRLARLFGFRNARERG
jgi:hypothetical protein